MFMCVPRVPTRTCAYAQLFRTYTYDWAPILDFSCWQPLAQRGYPSLMCDLILSLRELMSNHNITRLPIKYTATVM